MPDEENILKRIRVIAKVENSIPLSSDKDAYNAFLDMYDKGEIELHDMLERFKEYTRATFRHAGNPDPVDPLFDTPPEAPENSSTGEEPRKPTDKPEYTGEYPVMNSKVPIRVWKLTVLLLIAGVIGYAIGSPEGFTRLLESVGFGIYYGFLRPAILTPVLLIAIVGVVVVLIAMVFWKMVRNWILK